MPERETFNHIYFDCPTTSKLLAQFSDKYLDPNFSQAERVKENMFFLFDGIANSNSWVKKIVETKDDNWSRLWRGRTGGGRG